MEQTRKWLTRKMIVDIVTVVIAAIIAVTAAFLAWSFNDARNSDGAYVVDFDLLAPSVELNLGTEDDPLVPGDSGCRVLALVNDGNVDLTKLRVFLRPDLETGSYVDAAARIADDETLSPTTTTVPGASASTVPTPDSSDAPVNTGEDDPVDPNRQSTFPDYLSFEARYVDIGTRDDQDDLDVPVCGDEVLDDTAPSFAAPSVSALTGPDRAVLVDLGDGGPGEFTATPDGPDGRRIKLLEVRWRLAPVAPDDTQNVFGTIEIAFTAEPKA